MKSLPPLYAQTMEMESSPRTASSKIPMRGEGRIPSSRALDQGAMQRPSQDRGSISEGPQASPSKAHVGSAIQTLWVSKVIRFITTVAAIVLLTACIDLNDPNKGDLPLAKVDIQRMYAGWYIVATIPNRLERGIAGGYDVFSPDEDPGWLREDFFMWRGNITGPKTHVQTRIRVVPGTNDADWRVIWPLSLPFEIVYVDPDYRYVLFGEQNRSLGWIYSRTQTLSAPDYAFAMQKFSELGWDTSLFKKVVQTPDQVGAEGFWSDGIDHPDFLQSQ